MSEAVHDDPTMELFKKFQNPGLWYIKRNVPIFCAHKRKRKGKDGKEETLYEVGEKELEEVCEHYRKLSKESGVVPRIAIGHMENDGKEEDQPKVIGFARNLRVGTFGPGKKKAVLCDEWVMKEHAKEAGSYPYRSVEFYPSRMEIAGVSLLRRDPQLDLGIVLYQHHDPIVRHLYLDHKAGDARAFPALYSRLSEHGDPLTERLDNDWLVSSNQRGSLVCYQREIQMAEEKDPTEKPEAKTPEKPEKLAADGDMDADDMSDEEAEEYARHCYGHPHAMKYARHMAKKYAMPGGMNTGLPEPAGATPPPAGETPEAMRRREEASQYARVNARLDALAKENAQLKKNLGEMTSSVVTERRRNDLVRLQREHGIMLDVEEELVDCASMNAEQYSRHLKKIETKYERDPAGGKMIQFARGTEGEGGMSRQQLDQCLAYQRAHGCTWEEAMQKYSA